MRTRRAAGRVVAASIVSAAALGLNPGHALADPIGLAGSVSVQIPETPGDMDLTLTVNGQTYEFDDVDDSLGGTLIVGWAASQQEPSASLRGCPDGAPGHEILLEEATAGAVVWATWVSPTSQVLLGPVEVPSRDGFVTAGACVADERDGPDSDDGDEEPGAGDPPGNGQGQGNAYGHGNGQGQGQGNGNAYGHGNGGGHGHSNGRIG